MKKVLLAMVAVAAVGVASADLTGWEISGGVAYNESGTAFASSEATGITLLGVGSEFAGSTIDIAVLQGLTEVGSAGTLGIAPALLGGAYGLAFSDDGSAVGTATFLVVNGLVGSLADISVGDYVGVASATFDIVDLWPDGQTAPDTNQAITLGDVTTSIEVIPEPATIGLMGIAGMGLFLARRKARR